MHDIREGSRGKGMARLPQPGGDSGNWGTILNEYLSQSHMQDGSLKDIPQSKITNLHADLATKIDTTRIGQPNGPAELDSTGKLVDSQTPVRLSAANLNITYASQTAVPALYQQTFESIINPGLLNGRAALANWENSRAKVLFLGDSLTYGLYVSESSKRFASVCMRQLRARLGNAPGLEFLPAGRDQSISTPPNAWTYSGALTTFSGFGPGRYAIALQSSGQAISKTVHGNRVDIWTTKLNPGGILSVRVNGSQVTTINTANSIAEDGQVTTVSLGSDGDYTLELAWLSGGRIEVTGVDVFNSTNYSAGIHSYIAGRPGYRTGDFVFDIYSWGRAMQKVNPSIVVYELGVNDYSGNIPPSTTEANIRAQLAWMRANFTSKPSFVLMPVWLRTGSYTYQWQEYVDVMKRIAADFPADTTVLDLSVRMPPVASDTLGLYAEQTGQAMVHLSDKGAALVGSTLAQFLLPR